MKAIANMKQSMAEFKAMDAKDKRSKVIDTLLNNAIYILLVIFVIFTATRNANFIKISSIVNIISLAASSLPIALGLAFRCGGCTFGHAGAPRRVRRRCPPARLS